MAAQPVSDTCIFCRIVKGEIPSMCVYEDAGSIAFLDINPIARGHTLVIPKGHYETIMDIPEDAGPAVFRALARVGKAVMAATGAAGFNCLQNNYPAAGQVVPHSHWHIIPRFEGDGLNHWPHDTNADKDAMLRMAEAIRREFG